MSILMVELQSGALACAGFGLGTGGSNAVEDFPGYEDAGKLLDWLTQKLSQTSLATDLRSKIQEASDEPTCP